MPDDLAALEADRAYITATLIRFAPVGRYAESVASLDRIVEDTRRLLDERKEQDRVAAVAFLAGATDEREHSTGWTADEQQNHQEHDEDIRLAERERTRAEVAGLPSWMPSGWSVMVVDRAAVLAIVEKP